MEKELKIKETGGRYNAQLKTFLLSKQREDMEGSANYSLPSCNNILFELDDNTKEQQ